jgi:methionine--tRNA ligase beta chain
MITFEEFKKIELKIATIKEVLDHPDANKLYVLKIDIGGVEKQIVAGIKLKYDKEQLLGKQIVVVANLEPVVIRGVESQAMLLAASDENSMAVLSPDKPIASGSLVK